MSTINPHTTRATGTVLTAAIYNFDHQNHVANATALNLDKLEGATPPVPDGGYVVFDGTGGSAIRAAGETPYVGGGADVAIADGGTGQSTALLGFNALKQDMTETLSGVAEMATDGEIRSAAAGAKAFMAADLETAAAFVTLTDAATVAVDWDTFINGFVTVTANRIIGNPTNGQAGTFRNIMVQGNDATDRVITFGGQYLGEVPTIIDVDSGRAYLLSIVCITSTHFAVSAKRVFG